MEFGPEIKVDGKRPEWFYGYDGALGYQRDSGVWYGPNTDSPMAWTESEILSNKNGWSSIVAIRLPANHPHYTTPTRTPLEDRMVALVKAIGSETSMAAWLDHTAEARAILAEMEPVDVLEVVIDDAMRSGNDVSAFEIAEAIRNSREACSAIALYRSLEDVTPCTRAQFEEACRV